MKIFIADQNNPNFNYLDDYVLVIKPAVKGFVISFTQKTYGESIDTTVREDKFSKPYDFEPLFRKYVSVMKYKPCVTIYLDPSPVYTYYQYFMRTSVRNAPADCTLVFLTKYTEIAEAVLVMEAEICQ